MMKLKSKIKIIQNIILVVGIVFSSLLFSACKKTSTTDLTLQNYSDYLQITSGASSGAGGWNFWMPNCSVRIKKVSDTATFKNVTITYRFKLYDASGTINLEQDFTESLGDMETVYSKFFQLQFGHTNGSSPPALSTTVEVLEISGTSTLISGEHTSMFIGIGLLFVVAFGLLLFFPIRASIFSGKFRGITDGMAYNEVIYILGDPSDSRSAKGITTCMWRRSILRGWTKTYILTFRDGRVILDIENFHWC